MDVPPPRVPLDGPVVVAGVDGSDDGDSALRLALREAACCGAEVLAVAAWQVPVYGWELATVDPDLLDAAWSTRATLQEALARVARPPAVPAVHTAVVQGPAARVLEEAAQEADLVVVGRRDTGRLGRLLHGTTTAALLHHAPCPVVVAPPDWHGQGAGRVVVGVDGSRTSAVALGWAARRALDSDRVLVPVRVRVEAESAVLATAGAPPVAVVEAAEVDRLSRAAREAAGTVALDVRAQVRQGEPEAALQEAAAPEDLLVVGSRGRAGVAGWLLGSVSAALVRSARCAVAVVRA